MPIAAQCIDVSSSTPLTGRCTCKMLGARAGSGFRRVNSHAGRYRCRLLIAGQDAAENRATGGQEQGNPSTATPSALRYFRHRLATQHSNPKQPTHANTLNITPGVRGDFVNLCTYRAGQEEVLSRHSMSVQRDSEGVGTARKVVARLSWQALPDVGIASVPSRTTAAGKMGRDRQMHGGKV